MKQPKTHSDPGSAGFVLLTVLIAVGVITGLVAAYGRHVVVEGRSGMSALPLIESREACHSGVRFARQALVSGDAAGSNTVPSGSCSATYTITSLPLGNQALEVESFGDDGLGARRLLELGVKVSPASLSSSSADARVQILGDVVAHDVQLTHAGTLGGNVSAVNTELASSSALDRLGMERKGIDWSGELQLGGGLEPIFLAAVTPATSLNALYGIIGYWSAD